MDKSDYILGETSSFNKSIDVKTYIVKSVLVIIRFTCTEFLKLLT